MVYYTEMSYRFHAENYSIKMNAGQNQLEIFRRPRFRTSQLGCEPEQRRDFHSFNESYESFCRPQTVNFSQSLNVANENIMYDFVRMVRDGVPPQADLRTAVRVQGLAEAIEASGRLKHPVELSPVGLPVGI